ncbi:MAG: amidase [Desulfobacterales bacterium]|nr:MAG: amidase [Desulfobacterales bacterium]
MTETDLNYITIAAAADGIRAGQLSPVELTEHLLARIESLDPQLNGFRLVCRDRALEDARAAETALRAGQDLGPLQGIPYAAKDIFNVRGLPTTAGCSLLASNIPEEDAYVVQRLAQGGMILMGKTNTVQFAYGGVGINHDHGTPHNPWRPEHYIPGGSSSGSAVAVAAGLVPMALGSDTGGSVRIPASLCGVTGLKTTVGRISRTGIYPLSWTLDSVGPLTRSVEDAALVYQCLQERDYGDVTTWGMPTCDVLKGLKDGVRGLRLAFHESVFWENVHPEVEKAVQACGPVFEDLGAHVQSVQLPEVTEAREIASAGLIIAAEAYNINRKWLKTHFNQIDPVVAFRLVKGKEIKASDYLQSIQACQRLQAKMNHSLRDVDALLVPATVIPALPVVEVDADMEMYRQWNMAYLQNTSVGNILKLCGLSVPCGLTREGLPIGLMIYGKSFHEDMVLRVGYAYQQATSWHKRLPDLAWAGLADGPSSNPTRPSPSPVGDGEPQPGPEREPTG